MSHFTPVRALLALAALSTTVSRLLSAGQQERAGKPGHPDQGYQPTASGWFAAPQAARNSLSRLASRIRVVSLSDREELYGLTFPVMRRYCERHGYVCDLATSGPVIDRPAQWAKIRVLQQALHASDPPPEYVLWVDDDILLTALDVPLEWFIQESGFSTSHTKLLLHEKDYTGMRVQSGMLMVKAGGQAAASIALLEEVWQLAALYPKKLPTELEDQRVIDHLYASLERGLDPLTRVPTNGARDLPYVLLPERALQSRSSAFYCGLYPQYCFKLGDFSVHACGMPLLQRVGVLQEVGSAAFVLPPAGAFPFGDPAALKGPWCLYDNKQDMLRELLVARSRVNLVALTDVGTPLVEWLLHEIQPKLLTHLQADSSGTMEEQAAAHAAASELQAASQPVNTTIAARYGPPLVTLAATLHDVDFPAVVIDILPQLPEKELLPTLELAFRKTAHAGLLIGTGYHTDIPGSIVSAAVNALCQRYGLEIIASSADASAAFAVRVLHYRVM